MSRVTSLLVLALIGSLVVGPGIALATEDPRFEASVAETRVVPGQTNALSVTLLNDADDADDRVEPATNVKAELLSDDTPFTVTSGKRYLGTVHDGSPIQTQFAIDVPQNVDSGSYTIPVQITYEYDGDEREIVRTAIDVIVSDRASFEIVTTSSDLQVDSDGILSVTVENTGSEPATDATLKLESRTSSVLFEGSEAGVRSLDSVKPGEQQTRSFSITASKTAVAGTYPITGTIKFDDTDGARRTSRPLAGNLTVNPEQSVSVTKASTDLQVGRDGTVSVNVTNDGPETIQNGELQLQPTAPILHPSVTAIAVGDLDIGESAIVDYQIGVDTNAVATSTQLSFRLGYENVRDERKTSDIETVDVPIFPEQSVSVSKTSADLRVDRDGEVTVSVINNGPESVTDGNLKLDSPGTSLHPTQTEVAISDLEPGESTIATYEIDVDDDATASARQLTFHYSYNDVNGDRQTAGPETVRVEIRPDRPVFEVQPTNTTVPAGESGSVWLRLTNNDEQTVRSINAKAFTDAPVSITDDSSYVGTLDSGESTMLTFRVSAPADAQTKEYPISVDFQYDEPDGDTLLSDTYDIPVSISEGTTFLDQVTDKFGGLDSSADTILGASAGFGIAGIGIGTIFLLRRYRNDE